MDELERLRDEWAARKAAGLPSKKLARQIEDLQNQIRSKELAENPPTPCLPPDYVVTDNGDLHDYYTGSYMRPATAAERHASIQAAQYDGGAGVILVDEDGHILRADDRGADDARRCYVQD